MAAGLHSGPDDRLIAPCGMNIGMRALEESQKKAPQERGLFKHPWGIRTCAVTRSASLRVVRDELDVGGLRYAKRPGATGPGMLRRIGDQLG